MTVKRYTPTQCCEHDGTYVTYSDYQKLVAENARLIALAKGWASAVDDCYFNETGDIYTDSIDTCNEELSTIAPATDAAIAEIKAHDINLLIDKLSGLPFTIGVSCGYVKEFAANLRAGRKG
jgi:hypothetical protein